MYKIKHDRSVCIGCGACFNVAGNFWEMSDVDGLASMVCGKKRSDDCHETEIREEEFQINMEAAQCCPVNAIHLIEISSGEQLI